MNYLLTILLVLTTSMAMALAMQPKAHGSTSDPQQMPTPDVLALLDMNADNYSNHVKNEKAFEHSTYLVIEKCHKAFTENVVNLAHPLKNLGRYQWYLHAYIFEHFLNFTLDDELELHGDYWTTFEYRITMLNSSSPEKNAIWHGFQKIRNEKGLKNNELLVIKYPYLAIHNLLNENSGFLKNDSIQIKVELTINSLVRFNTGAWSYPSRDFKKVVPTFSILARDPVLQNHLKIKKSKPFVAHRFNWYLVAENLQDKYLNIDFYVDPSNDIKEDYQIIYEYRFTILNNELRKTYVDEGFGVAYRKGDKIKRTKTLLKYALIQRLLNPKNGFLKGGSIDFQMAFTVHSSSTPSHLFVAKNDEQKAPANDVNAVGKMSDGTPFQKAIPTLVIRDFTKLITARDHKSIEKSIHDLATKNRVNVNGFEWELRVASTLDGGVHYLTLFLDAIPPTELNSPYYMIVKCQTFILGASSKYFLRNSNHYLDHTTKTQNASRLCTFTAEELLSDDFLGADGTLEIEVYFTVESLG